MILSMVSILIIFDYNFKLSKNLNIFFEGEPTIEERKIVEKTSNPLSYFDGELPSTSSGTNSNRQNKTCDSSDGFIFTDFNRNDVNVSLNGEQIITFLVISLK